MINYVSLAGPSVVSDYTVSLDTIPPFYHQSSTMVERIEQEFAREECSYGAVAIRKLQDREIHPELEVQIP